ncbi:helix-turn-helix domain-containing protein [Brevibacillus laterosporus]|uniref:Helix-turn-helix domain-containing protein n=1 Tax=Brevibacillus laterosporus TaxID=1465 RepID=A0AAP3DK45_BRELA|nr:helix-turn-helix domain-containing protein [Brevibacillus laterosporus]MCR8982432.1 helix-turn-helix domain-containing protein [Brevibacillus laterosporus]MCZ0809588.1 helix-turn-helix domain-containing protein [Brevibacillus laterosporus]MCZ0828121.1 helix-turn-helix domain-containing protein [Brevibacillus laterosporus]MCZ0852143.1 helix-turn-helix domain-containing protein [Brevibacillus laterosporus]
MSKKEKRNLKKKVGELTYFRFVDTDQKENCMRKRTNKKTGIEEIQTYQKTVQEKRFYSEEEVRKFSLEKLRDTLPKEHGNVTYVDNYFLNFWGPILGCQATMVYIYLLQPCYGLKDYCYPDLDTLSAKLKMSIPTLRSYLKVLEQHGFIMRFWVLNPENHNLMESCLYKVRKTVPMLSAEEIKSLPLELQKEHDKYIAELSESHEIMIQESYDTQQAYKEFEESGKLIKSTKTATAEELQKYYEARITNHFNKRTSNDAKLWKNAIVRLGQRVSISSLENWFTQAFCITNPNNPLDITIVCKNNFVKEWVSSRYKNVLEDAFMLLVEGIPVLNFVAIVDMTEEENKQMSKLMLPSDLLSTDEITSILTNIKRLRNDSGEYKQIL